MKPITSLLSKYAAASVSNKASVILHCNDDCSIEVISFISSKYQFSIKEGDETDYKRVSINKFEKIVEDHGGIFDIIYENY